MTPFRRLMGPVRVCEDKGRGQSSCATMSLSDLLHDSCATACSSESPNFDQELWSTSTRKGDNDGCPADLTASSFMKPARDNPDCTRKKPAVLKSIRGTIILTAADSTLETLMLREEQPGTYPFFGAWQARAEKLRSVRAVVARVSTFRDSCSADAAENPDPRDGALQELLGLSLEISSPERTSRSGGKYFDRRWMSEPELL